ncbi:hypothetical protein C5E41_19685 [Nocardia nova]|nr:hypothetical protein C5E41_19685 [Nocardia nova]
MEPQDQPVHSPPAADGARAGARTAQPGMAVVRDASTVDLQPIRSAAGGSACLVALQDPPRDLRPAAPSQGHTRLQGRMQSPAAVQRLVSGARPLTCLGARRRCDAGDAVGAGTRRRHNSRCGCDRLVYRIHRHRISRPDRHHRSRWAQAAHRVEVRPGGVYGNYGRRLSESVHDLRPEHRLAHQHDHLFARETGPLRPQGDRTQRPHRPVAGRAEKRSRRIQPATPAAPVAHGIHQRVSWLVPHGRGEGGRRLARVAHRLRARDRSGRPHRLRDRATIGVTANTYHPPFPVVPTGRDDEPPPGRRPRMSPTERIFFAAESHKSPQHVAVLARFRFPDDAPDGYVHDLVAAMRAVTTVVAPFNYRLRQSPLRTLRPAWEVLDDDRVDLDYHCRHLALPETGSEREFGALVSHLHSRPLDLTRPLWEWVVIEGFAQRCWALYFKVHHALMDGAGGGLRAKDMLTIDPGDRGVRPIWSLTPTVRPARAATGSRRRGIGQALSITAAVSALTVRMVRDRRHGDADLAVPFAAPRTLLNRRIGTQRRFATQSYDLDRVTALAAASGTTVNEVYLTIVGGGLRRYLHELGQLPDRTLTAATPVNVREHDHTSHNAFTMTVMNLGTDIADPYARLAAVQRSSTRAKTELRRLPAHVVPLSAASFMGPFVVQNLLGLGGRTAPPYNVAVSNVPLFSEDMYLAGSRLEEAYPLAIAFHGVGLFISVFAAAGRFNIGFTGDRDSLPHLQRLAVYTGRALEELEDAVLGKEP